jgi:YfiH family protein
MLGTTSPLLSSIAGVSHRFFGRVGGTSPHPWTGLNTSYDVRDAPARIDENLARVRFQLGVPRGALFSCAQVHGCGVVVVGDDDDPDEVLRRRADALVTGAQHLAVAVRTADCAPILIAAEDGSVVAAVHAGWRGAVGGVIEAALDAIDRAPAELVAAVGPTIGQGAFEVGPEVVAAARGVSGVDVDRLVRGGRDDRVHFDLAGFVAAVLRSRGVERVDVVAPCTSTNEAAYFSHRRDVTLRKGIETGRQMSAIARTTTPALDEDTFR